MTGEKILEVVSLYERTLNTHFPSITAGDADHHERNPRWQDQIAHLKTMPDKVKDFVKQTRLEKSFRWLGFMQGVLWAQGRYTLDELMNHNRPPESFKTELQGKFVDTTQDELESIPPHERKF